MDWSRIKTIFIIAFLILDGFLLFWLLDKQYSKKLPLTHEASFEERLEADEIIVENMPADVDQEQFFINAVPKIFTEEEQELLKLNGHRVEINEEGIEITVTLDEPIKITQEVTASNMEPIISSVVLYGDQYELWENNSLGNKIVYYQTYKNFTLFNNQNGRIIFTISENNEITEYTQTMFEPESFKEYGEQNILDAMVALETLHSNRKLMPGSKVNNVELGYYTLVQLTSQVLAPTWHFTINDQEDLFVNAIEGRIIEMNDLNTITE